MKSTYKIFASFDIKHTQKKINYTASNSIRVKLGHLSIDSEAEYADWQIAGNFNHVSLYTNTIGYLCQQCNDAVVKMAGAEWIWILCIDVLNK